MKMCLISLLGFVRGSLDQSLKDTLKKFSTEKRFAYWSGYVKSLAFHMAETEGSSCTSLTEYQMLISAWRMLLIISTGHVRATLTKNILNRNVPSYWEHTWCGDGFCFCYPVCVFRIWMDTNTLQHNCLGGFCFARGVRKMLHHFYNKCEESQ